jgi:hypothetical protein
MAVRNVVLVHGVFADGSSWSKVIHLSVACDSMTAWLDDTGTAR